MTQARHDEQSQHEQLDDDEDVVRPGALPHAEQQQPGDQTDDKKGRHVHEDRDAGEVGRAVEETVDRGVGAEQRGAIPGREPVGQVDAEVADEGLKVVAPGNRHGDVSDCVLEDQVPPDDPGDHLAERGVRIRVGAPRLRNHRRQLGVAEAGERAADPKQQEGEHECRAGAGAHHVPRGIELARRRRPDRAEDAGADDRADGEHDEIAGPEDAPQRLRRLQLADQKLRDRLPLKELPHEVPCVRCEP